jgi:hypothetical protein
MILWTKAINHMPKPQRPHWIKLSSIVDTSNCKSVAILRSYTGNPVLNSAPNLGQEVGFFYLLRRAVLERRAVYVYWRQLASSKGLQFLAVARKLADFSNPQFVTHLVDSLTEQHVFIIEPILVLQTVLVGKFVGAAPQWTKPPSGIRYVP